MGSNTERKSWNWYKKWSNEIKSNNTIGSNREKFNNHITILKTLYNLIEPKNVLYNLDSPIIF